MIPTSLAAALLAVPSAPIEQENLLDLLPTDAVLVATIGDMASLMEAESPPGMLGLMTDERLRDFVGALAAEEGAEDVMPIFDAVLGVARHVRGGGMAMTALEDGGGVAVLSVTDGFVPAMRAMAEAGGETLEEVTLLGASGYRVSANGGSTLQMVELSDVMLVGFGESEIADGAMRDVVAAMDEPSDAKRWWRTADVSRPDGAVFEVFVTLEQALEASPEFGRTFPNATVAYMGMGIGEGSASDAILELDFGENEVLGGIAGALGAANLDLLGLAPKNAMAAYALRVDVAAMIEAILTIADDESARSEFDTVMAGGSGILGVDVEGDIIDNLSGDFLFVQWPAAADAFESDDPGEMLAAAPMMMIGIEDNEPFYTVMETLEGLAGPDALEAMDSDAGTMWISEALPGTELGIGLSDTALFLGTSERVEVMMDRAAAKASTGMLDAAGMAAAREALSGAFVSAANIGEEGWEFVRAAFEADEAEVPGAAILIDLMKDHLPGLAFNEMDLSATRVSIRWIAR